MHRRKRCGRPAAQRFFYPRPVLFLPALDLCFFPLQGAALRFLGAPLQAVHQPTDMSAVIANSKLATDHLGNASRGPQIGPITMGQWSFEQQSDQAPALCGIQLPRTAGREAHLQSFAPPSSSYIAPTHHRTRIAPDASRHFIQRMTVIEQLQSPLAPVFQKIGTSLRPGHRCSPSEHLLLHYFCTGQ